MAGAVVVPVNTRFSESEVEYVITDSGAKVVLQPDAPLPDGDPHVDESARHDTLAAIFYTSGTTGFPKGAMTTHENFLSNSETCKRIMQLPEETQLRNLVSVPLFHVTGCNSQLIVTTQLGGTTVIMPAFEVQAFLRATVEERINILTSVPAIFWLAMSQPNFHEFDVSNVRSRPCRPSCRTSTPSCVRRPSASPRRRWRSTCSTRTRRPASASC
jgi:acyl-CoA synthetase (AMP-forming)/AMP-acid ligase II